MSDLIFDEPTIERHRTARFKFVPWMARFFSEGPVRADSPPLPVGREEALTDETVEAVQTIVNRACWQFLARECGWKRLDAVNPEDLDAHSIRRLWQRGQFLPTLQFSTATPDLLLTMFNTTRKDGNPAEIRMPDCLTRNGDLLIHHLVFRRIRTTPEAFGQRRDHRWDQWYPNPLNALYDPQGYRHFDSGQTRWDSLCEKDLAPFVPWIGAQQVKKWNRDADPFWAIGLEARLDWLEAITFLMTDWGLRAEKSKRIDLATFLLDLLADHHRKSADYLKDFEARTNQLPFRERQKLATRWTDFLELTTPLEESARKCSAVHPIERTGPEKCFLARWEALGFSKTISGLRELSQALRPSIN